MTEKKCPCVCHETSPAPCEACALEGCFGEKEIVTAKVAAERLCGKIPPLVGGEGFDCRGVELEGLLDQLQAFEPAAFEALRVGLERLVTTWADGGKKTREMGEWAEAARDGTSRRYTAAKVRRLMGLIFGLD